MHVALINMPFSTAQNPSIPLGILKSLLNELGIPSSTFNLNIDFKRYLWDLADPSTLKKNNSDRWFVQKLWGKSVPEIPEIPARLKPYAEAAERFIDDMSQNINWANFDLIAFSCTFYMIPALCLGKHIKKRHPQIPMIYGGSQFFATAAMELMKHLKWIDAIFVGEAEYSFPKFMSNLSKNHNLPSDIKGIAFRHKNSLVFNGVDSVEINDSPFPDYTDFFNDLPMQWDVLLSHENISVPYEASRGCWYGEKNHCKFCSLNHEMRFRTKHFDTIYDDVCRLWSLWKDKIGKIVFTDNILDKNNLTTVMPKIIKNENMKDFKAFVELKPDLKPDQIRILKEAGFDSVQAGIESFHPGMTKLMDKGQSVLNCISFLKWCKYYAIKVMYNLLSHIPFEKKVWYKEQLDVIKQITHLKLPNKLCSIAIQRFGVYYQQNLLQDMVPQDNYRYVFPDFIDKNEIAYTFDYDESVTNPDTEDTKTFLNSKLVICFLRFLSDELIIDNRDNSGAIMHEVSKSQFQLLKHCLVPTSSRDIRNLFSNHDIDYLLALKLMIEGEGKILSLVEIEQRDIVPVPEPKTIRLPLI